MNVLAAAVAFILTLWINVWTVVDNEPPPPPEPLSPAAVADRYAAADRVDRGTGRDPLPEPSPVDVPTPPPPPEPDPVQVPAPAPPQGPSTFGGSSGLPPLLALIRSCESGPCDGQSHGNYAAYNPSGCEGYGCGGAYQLHALYAPTWAARAGYPGLGGNAATWPPEVQDAVALDLFYSTNPDGAHWCNWVSYC